MPRTFAVTFSGMLLLALFLTLETPPAFGENAKLPIVTQLFGSNDASIIRRTGNHEDVAEGTVLEPGDRLNTGPGAGAEVKFADGNVLILSEKSHFTFAENPSAGQAGEMNLGTVRVRVPKSVAKAAEKKVRFFVRSRAVTLGVRGTDFVVQNGEGNQKTEVHTLEGEVGAAENEELLQKGQGTAIHEGEFTFADAGKISPPRTFDRRVYMADLEKSHPYLKVQSDRSGWRLLDLETGILGSTQVNGGYSIGPEILWHPKYEFGQIWSVGMAVGMTAFNIRNGGIGFGAIAAATFSVRPLPFLIAQTGIGYEYWAFAPPGPMVEIPIIGAFAPPNKWLWILERIYAGVYLFPAQFGVAASGSPLPGQVRMGIGISI